MVKNRLFWGVSFLAIITLLVITAFTSNQKSVADKLPTFMDVSGSITLSVGDFELDSQPFLGKPEAPIKVIEFADFKCPACKTWDTLNFPDFKKNYIDTGKVQFYFINFPFLGPDSIEAALAGETIYKQNPDKFWEFKEKLFQQQGKAGTIWATESFLLKFVKDNITEIDYNLFKTDLKNYTYLFDVKKDFKISAANGIYGTPSFVVNGEKVSKEDLTERIINLAK